MQRYRAVDELGCWSKQWTEIERVAFRDFDNTPELSAHLLLPSTLPLISNTLF